MSAYRQMFDAAVNAVSVITGNVILPKIESQLEKKAINNAISLAQSAKIDYNELSQTNVRQDLLNLGLHSK